MGSELIGIIPAAGKASRMGQLGDSMPKALIEIEGRTLLERAIESLKSLEVAKIVVVVGHLGDVVREYLGNQDFGIEIGIAHQETSLGLAHAIATAANQISSNFVVLCPDNIFTSQEDLQQARQILETRPTTFVLLATVTPSNQRDRKSYFTAARRALAPNLYDYKELRPMPFGIEMNSTGCVFFKHEALDFLPSFSQDQEHIFRDYLESIANVRECSLYLLRGMRYDFSSPHDVQEYINLKNHLRKAEGQGVSAILINDEGHVLLQQRDDNPNIRYPGHWALFGGSIENGESACEAVVREVEEEIAYELHNFGLFREFVQNNKREFAYAGEISATLNELTLSEGQGMNFFAPSELRNLQIRPDDHETLRKYFGD